MGARNLDELHKIETDLKSRGVDALSVQTDVTREADCKNLIEKTVERFGKIDILVNKPEYPCARYLKIWNWMLYVV